MCTTSVSVGCNSRIFELSQGSWILSEEDDGQQGRTEKFFHGEGAEFLRTPFKFRKILSLSNFKYRKC